MIRQKPPQEEREKRNGQAEECQPAAQPEEEKQRSAMIADARLHEIIAAQMLPRRAPQIGHVVIFTQGGQPSGQHHMLQQKTDIDQKHERRRENEEQAQRHLQPHEGQAHGGIQHQVPVRDAEKQGIGQPQNGEKENLPVARRTRRGVGVGDVFPQPAGFPLHKVAQCGHSP